jgi:DNA-binding NtrC family response regulator
MNQPSSILIIDDEKIVRESLSKWFFEDGYRVGSAGDAPSALRQLESQSWDIILLDIKMPGMDGIELQGKIRERDPLSVIVFMTAHASVDTAVQALKAGAFDYVTKPVDPDYLSHLIRNAVKQRSLQQENSRLKALIAEGPKLDEIIGESLAAVEKAHIARVLHQHGWNISRSAEILEIDRVTLYNKIHKYGLKKP